MNTLDLIYKK